jgi:Ni/Co efflux regulator RcnB
MLNWSRRCRKPKSPNTPSHREKTGPALFVFSAALAAPLAITATAKPQDSGRQEDNHRDDKDHSRDYDHSHKDYHNWDGDEDRSYHQYLGEKHKNYRPFTETKPKEQTAYWNWRHSRPDHDNGR